VKARALRDEARCEFRDMRGISLLLMALTAASCEAADHKLRAAPVLPNRGILPTFRVECRNNTSQPVERVNVVSALRFDGTLLEPGLVGSFLGGPPAPVPSGSTWSEIVSLAPAGTHRSGLTVRAFHVPLQPGRHTVAFRCAGLWSEDVVFYWEP
jgi:hypothetical protein